MELLIGSPGSESAEAELDIFGSPGRPEVQKWNFRSLAVKEVRKRNFRSLAVKAKRKFGRGTSHLWQSRQSGSAEGELQVCGRQGRADVRKQNFTSLAVKIEWKC